MIRVTDPDPQHAFLISEMKTLELATAGDNGSPGQHTHGSAILTWLQDDLFPEARVQGQGIEPLADGGEPAQLGMGQEGEDPQHHLIGHPLEGRTTL